MDILSKIIVVSTIIIVVTLGLIFLYPIKTVIVSGDSMYPTYTEGDEVIYTKFFSKEDIIKNSIVVFNMLNTEDMLVIKRVIAVEGDFIEIIDNDVYVNGEILIEYCYKDNKLIMYTSDLSYKVDKDEIFVLGDNRNHSIDSRDYGCVKVSSVIGILTK